MFLDASPVTEAHLLQDKEEPLCPNTLLSRFWLPYCPVDNLSTPLTNIFKEFNLISNKLLGCFKKKQMAFKLYFELICPKIINSFQIMYHFKGR